jgi:3-isopropylmalate dehydrogenase
MGDGMKVVCLPGDGIGPEVMAEAVRVLPILASDIEVETKPLGASALASHGEALPGETLEACQQADAVLMGAVGLDNQLASDAHPEGAMFSLRRELDVYANLRPFQAPGIDLLVVRELVGGLYFGARGTRADGVVYDTCEYHPDQVERILRRGFELAQDRNGRLTSVDKANVLATSRMWRRTAARLAEEFPSVEVEHLLVDTAAMRLVQAPDQFDVIVTENTFGDILSDVAAAVCGGIGIAASASLSDSGAGLFEPVHGTAPDIAGKGLANPTAMLLSTAMMFRFGMGRTSEADSLVEAVQSARAHAPTADEGGTAGTRDFGEAVARWLTEHPVDGRSDARSLDRLEQPQELVRPIDSLTR